MSTSVRTRHARGFSMIELMVTVLLAGIIFAAMVPMFANALKKTSGDNFRITATNIAQDRLEKVRQLNYADITVANLNSSTYAGSQFGTSYIPPASNKTYTINYVVYPGPSPSPQLNYKKVAVTVTYAGPGSHYVTTMSTIVMDPASVSATSTSNPYPTPSAGYSLTVTFKNWTQVTSAGVVVVQVMTRAGTPTPVPTRTVTVSPTRSPTSGSPTLTWTGLAGGRYINYLVTCHSTYITATAPVFHLFTNGWMKFDTHPGGS